MSFTQMKKSNVINSSICVNVSSVIISVVSNAVNLFTAFYLWGIYEVTLPRLINLLVKLKHFYQVVIGLTSEAKMLPKDQNNTGQE